MTLNRDEIEFVLSDNRYLKGGTKEACVRVRQVLKKSQNNCNQLHESFSSVENDEFLEAVKVLMAAAFKKEDEIPETWYCDNDCKMVSNLLCPGECNLSNDSKKRCPFFIDEHYV